jgi:hypothetical protein
VARFLLPVACSQPQQPFRPGAGNVAHPVPRKDSDAIEGEQVLMKDLGAAIQYTVAEVNENERLRDTGSIESGLQSIVPTDPNLQCVTCGKIFKIGQIQNFKRHSDTCTGSTQ